MPENFPAELIFGGPEHASRQVSEPTEYVSNLAEHMEKVHNLARDNLAKSGERQKRSYDLKQLNITIK